MGFVRVLHHRICYCWIFRVCHIAQVEIFRIVYFPSENVRKFEGRDKRRESFPA